MYFAATAWGAVYKLSSGVMTLVAGIPGIVSYSGDWGPATSASLRDPGGVAVDISTSRITVTKSSAR